MAASDNGMPFALPGNKPYIGRSILTLALKVERIEPTLPMMLEAVFVSRTLSMFHRLRSVHINIFKKKKGFEIAPSSIILMAESRASLNRASMPSLDGKGMPHMIMLHKRRFVSAIINCF